MNCQTCNHIEHIAGQCENCNCGESSIVRPKRNFTHDFVLFNKLKNGAVRHDRIDCGGKVGIKKIPNG